MTDPSKTQFNITLALSHTNRLDWRQFESPLVRNGEEFRPNPIARGLRIARFRQVAEEPSPQNPQ